MNSYLLLAADSSYPYWAVLLLALGLALVVAEVFIPSGGMILVMSIICLVVSIWCAYNAWWVDSPWSWWSFIAILILLLPTAVGGALYLFPRTEWGKKVLMEPPSLDEVTPYTKEEERLAQMVGQQGKTLTLLNPGGLVLVEGERMHSESEDLMIEPGVDVDVVAVKANRLLVRVAATKRESPDQELVDENPEEEGPPLDFDDSQS